MQKIFTTLENIQIVLILFKIFGIFFPCFPPFCTFLKFKIDPRCQLFKKVGAVYVCIWPKNLVLFSFFLGGYFNKFALHIECVTVVVLEKYNGSQIHILCNWDKIACTFSVTNFLLLWTKHMVQDPDQNQMIDTRQIPMVLISSFQSSQ